MRGRQAAQGSHRTSSKSPDRTPASDFRQSQFYPPTVGVTTSFLPGPNETLTGSQINRMKAQQTFAESVDQARTRQEKEAAAANVHTLHQPRPVSSFSRPRPPQGPTSAAPALAATKSINFSRPRSRTPTGAQPGPTDAGNHSRSRSRSRSPVKSK